MKLKLLIPFLLMLGFATVLDAEEKKEPFSLNGKPVPEIVATVNGISIHSQTLKRDFFAFRLRARQMSREIQPAEEISIARELVKAAVGQELVVQKARALGISITDEQVDRQLNNIEDQFPNHAAFLASLAFQHMSIESLKEKIQRTLLEDELMRREIAPKVEVSEKSIKQYYDQNIAKFTKPVLYRVRHIHVATLKPSENVEDETSRKKAERLVKMVNKEARKNIESILKKVQSGEDFAALARRYSEDEASRESGGVLGDLHPDATLPEIGNEMIKLGEGETSGIFQSQFGYHILKLDEIVPSQLIPFSEANTDIMNFLLKMKTQDHFKVYLADLEKKAKIQILL